MNSEGIQSMTLRLDGQQLVYAGGAVTLPSGAPLTVKFDPDMAGMPPVFQKGYLASLNCVAEVAR